MLINEIIWYTEGFKIFLNQSINSIIFQKISTKFFSETRQSDLIINMRSF